MRIFILFMIFIAYYGCSKDSSLSQNEPEPPQEIINVEDRILIVDQTGKEWDITHAVNEYGFDPARFQFGLGPLAIRPIQNPEMLSPGDPGYPSENATYSVIGVNMFGHTRAYPLSVLSSHEIVNEEFSDTHVSVAY